ncbi:MAG: abortive infection protein, partial [Ectothiorhodospiraceae bacterium]|nr:abortive infection protein [Ectothiorhodospiraceae bacterium]
VLLVIVVLRKNPVDFGLRLGDVRFGLKVSAIFYAVMVPILWIVSDMSSFQEMYPHVLLVRDDWELFMIYEAGLILYFIGWEYIWRGFMLFGLAPHTGGGVAILIQTIPFVILHYGKPMPETIGAVIAGIALGALALRTRSFWYCVLIHWSVMITIDVFCTVRHRAGISGIGIEALSNFIGYLL